MSYRRYDTAGQKSGQGFGRIWLSPAKDLAIPSTGLVRRYAGNSYISLRMGMLVIATYRYGDAGDRYLSSWVQASTSAIASASCERAAGRRCAYLSAYIITNDDRYLSLWLPLNAKSQPAGMVPWPPASAPILRGSATLT